MQISNYEYYLNIKHYLIYYILVLSNNWPRLIASKIKVILHNICVYSVYIYYINTDTRMYIFKTNIVCVYVQYIYIWYNI